MRGSKSVMSLLVEKDWIRDLHVMMCKYMSVYSVN